MCGILLLLIILGRKVLVKTSGKRKLKSGNKNSKIKSPIYSLTDMRKNHSLHSNDYLGKQVLDYQQIEKTIIENDPLKRGTSRISSIFNIDLPTSFTIRRYSFWYIKFSYLCFR